MACRNLFFMYLPIVRNSFGTSGPNLKLKIRAIPSASRRIWAKNAQIIASVGTIFNLTGIEKKIGERKEAYLVSVTIFTSGVVLKPLLVLRPTNKLQNECHPRAGGSPVQKRLNSRQGGNDGWIKCLSAWTYFRESFWDTLIALIEYPYRSKYGIRFAALL